MRTRSFLRITGVLSSLIFAACDPVEIERTTSGGGHGVWSGEGAGGRSGSGASVGSGEIASSSSGGGLPCTFDIDCPQPQGPCMTGICIDGVCSVFPAPETAPCGTCHCDGFGHCAGPSCISDAICPTVDDPCFVSKCVGCEECAVFPRCAPDQTCNQGICSP